MCLCLFNHCQSRYGLIIPKQQKAAAAAIIRKSVFDEDNELHDEDDEEEALQVRLLINCACFSLTPLTCGNVYAAARQERTISHSDDVQDKQPAKT